MSKSEVNFYWEKPIDPLLIKVAWEDAFSRKISNEQWIQLWDWRFLNNPFSDKIIAAYVLKSNTIACFYAVSPMLLLLPDGSIVKTGLMNMGFTHPQFRSKGYYIEINRQLNDQIKDMGFQCIYGFANNNSHYSYRKYLQWKDISLLTNFQLFKNNVKNTNDHMQDISSRLINLSDELIMCISNYVVTQRKYHILRSFDMLKWRLLDHPLNDYNCIITYQGESILAYTIFKTYMNNEADIMEIFYPSSEVNYLSSVIFSIIDCLLKKGYKYINIWSNLYSEEHLILEKIGFQEQLANTYFGVISFSNLGEIISSQNWHYRFLDSDLY